MRNRNTRNLIGIAAILLLVVFLTIQITLTMQQNSDASSGERPDGSSTFTEGLGARASSKPDTPTAPLPTTTFTPIVITIVTTPILPSATPLPPSVTPTAIPVITATPEPTQPVQSVALQNLTSEARLLSAENLTTSADDNVVLDIVSSEPLAVGFVGRAAYRNQRDVLRALRFELDDGRVVGPSPDAVFDGSYPISRLLYVYTTQDAIRGKPEVAAFLGCYLSRINEEILDSGFFPARGTVFEQTLRTYNTIMGNPVSTALPTCDVSTVSGTIEIAGSTTVAPITQQIMDLFNERGYSGDIRMDALGTDAGFKRFCVNGAADIINADRQIKARELANCRALGREPVAFAIGEDALSVVVSAQNDFADMITLNQLQQVFSTARYWSDINPTWPRELILRVIPNQTGGTFATFVSKVFDREVEQVVAPAIVAPASPTPVQAPQATAPPTVAVQTNTESSSEEPLVFAHGGVELLDSEYDYVLAFVPQRPACLKVSQVIQKIIEENFDVIIWLERHNDMPELYADYRALEKEELNHMTLCYLDPDDRTQLVVQGDWMRIVGNGYWRNGPEFWMVALQSHVVADLQKNRPCLYTFLKNLKFADGPLDIQDPDRWIAENADLVDSWLVCES